MYSGNYGNAANIHGQSSLRTHRRHDHLAGIRQCGKRRTPTAVNVAISFLTVTRTRAGGQAVALSTGGTPLGLTFDDRYRANFALPSSSHSMDKAMERNHLDQWQPLLLDAAVAVEWRC